MTRRRGSGATAVALIVALSVASCGGGGSEADSTGAPPTTVTAGTPSTTVTTGTAPDDPRPPPPATTEPPVTAGPVTDPARPPAATVTPSTAAIDDPTTTGLTVSPTTTTSPATTIAPAGDLIACAAAIPRRERIALLVWPAVYSQDWDGAVRTVEQHQVGGVILMKPSGWEPDDVAPQLARLDAAARRGVVVATDEEGGVVQRLALLGELPSQQAMSEQRSVDEAGRLIAEHGSVLAAAGVDMALGPVLDVVPESGEVPLTRSRFFSGPPDRVADFGRAYVEGWQASGIAPVVKHYPGHGAASGDTHDEAGVTPSLEDLGRVDLVPFRALADTGVAVMVGHLTVPGLTDGLPATQSERAVRYLRDDLGYGDALVLSDALGMQAVGLPEDVAAVRALVAGIDVVLFTATGQTGPVIDAIERAAGDGTLTDERITLSASRVLRFLDPDRRGCG